MEPPRTALDLRNLSAVVEHWIEQRTGGRVHRLHVEIAEKDRVIVHGTAGSHHVRQLALAAALDALQANDGASHQVDLDICVGAGHKR
jgi:3-oxoacyl-[acyl-carrier-protein] synthase III